MIGAWQVEWYINDGHGWFLNAQSQEFLISHKQNTNHFRTLTFRKSPRYACMISKSRLVSMTWWTNSKNASNSSSPSKLRMSISIAYAPRLFNLFSTGSSKCQHIFKCVNIYLYHLKNLQWHYFKLVPWQFLVLNWMKQCSHISCLMI